MPMRRALVRSFVAGIAATAILSFAFTGHTLPTMDAHEGMTGAAAGLCILLVTVVCRIALSRDSIAPATVVSVTFSGLLAEPSLPRLDARARASPPQLQRFRN